MNLDNQFDVNWETQRAVTKPQRMRKVSTMTSATMSSLASSYDCMSDSSDKPAATVHIPGAGVFTRERDKENHVTGSVWGGETVSSHDSGWASMDGQELCYGYGEAATRSGSSSKYAPALGQEFPDRSGRTGVRYSYKRSRGGEPPDLLDCLIMEDLEERLEDIKKGTAKSSEVTCLRNLVNLLDLQRLQGQEEAPQVQVQSTQSSKGQSQRRAIVGCGAKPRESAGLFPAAPFSYRHDIQHLSSLLDQEVPLSFPGQMPPANIKLLPPGHPPDLDTRSRSASRSQISNKENIAPVSQGTFHEGEIPRPMMRKLKNESSIAVAQRAGEAFFHLKALIKERKNLEEQLRTKFPGSKVALTGPGPRETLDNLMAAAKEEETRLGVLAKALEGKMKKTSTEIFNQTFQEWSSKLSQVAASSRSYPQGGGGGGCEVLLDRLGQLSSTTRGLRTVVWTLHSSLS